MKLICLNKHFRLIHFFRENRYWFGSSHIKTSWSCSLLNGLCICRPCSSGGRPARCSHHSGGQGNTIDHICASYFVKSLLIMWSDILSLFTLFSPSTSPATYGVILFLRSAGWRMINRCYLAITTRWSLSTASLPASPSLLLQPSTRANTPCWWRTSMAQRRQSLLSVSTSQRMKRWRRSKDAQRERGV